MSSNSDSDEEFLTLLELKESAQSVIGCLKNLEKIQQFNKMEQAPSHPLIHVTIEDMKKVRKFYDLEDVRRIRESLDQIEEWCKKQPHLEEAQKYMSRVVIERIFLLARGSVEESKKKLDRLFTSRGMIPELALNRSYEEFANLLDYVGSVEESKKKLDRLFTSRGMIPELALNRSYEEFANLLDYVHYVPLPKIHPADQSRVMVTQFLSGKLDNFNLLTYFRYTFMVGEYRLYYDYVMAERFIIDLQNIHIGLLKKVNPMVVKKAEVLCTEGYGTKIKGIHILNAPPFVDRLVFILKQALREKVASRLHVHPSYEDLHKHIPKEILPKDYGGDGPSCAKLNDQWKENFQTEEARKEVKNLDKLVSDETKRTNAKFNEEYLGMPGSFRKLEMD